jgi:hypothetical protein
LENKDDAIKKLLAGDVNVPPDPQNPTATDNNTAPAKRYYFLQYFMPFLRERLYQRLIVDTTSGAAGLASDVTKLLLSDVLVAGTPSQSAMTMLEQIKDIPPGNPTDFKGYLIPSADDQYTFVAIADTPPTVSIDGHDVSFPHQQDDPSNVWSSDPLKLKAGKLYPFEIVKSDSKRSVAVENIHLAKGCDSGLGVAAGLLVARHKGGILQVVQGRDSGQRLRPHCRRDQLLANPPDGL